MKQKGKKHNAWVKARAKIIKRAVEEGRISINESGNIVGICTDCKKFRPLTPDHVKKRGVGGKDTYNNIEWVCWKCHNLRDNYGDPMGKKDKNKKSVWEKSHKCINCKQPTRQYLCHNCGMISVKQ